MKVNDVMTKKVITVKPDDTLETVLKKFTKYKISGMPVVNKKKEIVGIVTEADVIKTIDAFSPKIRYDSERSFAIVLAVLRHKNEIEAIRKEIIGSGKIKVRDFMCKDVITISPDKSVDEAARIMTKYKIDRIPVVKNKKLVGIIARADIIKALAK